MDDNNINGSPEQPEQVKIQGGGFEATVTPAGISANVPVPRGGGAIVAAADDGQDGNFFAQLKGVPVDYLITTPLIATARANMGLAQVMCQFIDEIGFDPKDKKKSRIVTFMLTRPYTDPTSKEVKSQTIKVEAPLLGLVPIPALLVQSATVDLTVEISNTISNTTNTTAESSLNVGANWGWGNASFTGSFSCANEQTRATNQAAKYQVTVNAQQQSTPEGMARLMDVMASCMTPIPA